jgi:hypothetical protein
MGRAEEGIKTHERVDGLNVLEGAGLGVGVAMGGAEDALEVLDDLPVGSEWNGRDETVSFIEGGGGKENSDEPELRREVVVGGVAACPAERGDGKSAKEVEKREGMVSRRKKWRREREW